MTAKRTSLGVRSPQLKPVRLPAFEKALDQLEADINSVSQPSPPGPPTSKAETAKVKAQYDALKSRYDKARQKSGR